MRRSFHVQKAGELAGLVGVLSRRDAGLWVFGPA